MNMRFLCAAAAFAFCVTAGFCAEVGEERAVDAVSAWIARSPAPSRLPTGEVRTFSMNGTNAFHLVAINGGGWVAMPADDRYDPVLAFTTEGDLPDEDDGDPGWDVIANYVGMGAFGEDEIEVFGLNDRPRFSVSAKTTSLSEPSKPLRLSSSLSSGSRQPTGLTWESLESDKSGSPMRQPRLRAVVQYSGTPADVRVLPLTKTKWSQGGVSGEYCYNYYTPNHYVCGCTATAMAQTMYYFQWPQTPMPEGTFKVTVNGVTQYFPMERGTEPCCFRWGSMPLNPKNADSHSEENRKAIGMLTYNCGLAASMNYRSDGSGAATTRAANGYRNSFGYSSADYVSSATLANITKTILPNLDAKIPCHTEYPGHATVTDGYAFSEGCLFVHMNMGWSGSSDAYYRQLLQDGNRTITRFVCNIATNGTPRFVTGRVINALGEPLADAAVKVSVFNGESLSADEKSTTTDEHGIYAFRIEAANLSVQLTAEKVGYMTLQGSRKASVSTAATGSSWGNDFVLVDTESASRWTGNGNGATLGDGANWEGGIPPADGATLVFGAGAPSVITNDIRMFAPAAMVFLSDCGKVTVRGEPFVGVGAMASSASERPMFDTAVTFSDTINVSGEIEFPGGVWGTVPENHTTYRGDYHLTTENWWQPPPDTVVPAGSTLYVKNYEGASQYSLSIEKNGEVSVDNARISGVQGYLMTRNRGKFTVRNSLAANSTEIDRLVDTSYESDDGVFAFNSITGANDVPKYLPPTFTYIIGEGGISGSFWRSYRDYSITLNTVADYSITGTISDYESATSPNRLFLMLKDVYTGVPHKATVDGAGALVGGNLQVRVDGGTLHIARDACSFGGGLFVENGATLELGAGCSPGGGDVTFDRGTTLEMPASRDSLAIVKGSVAVAGSGTGCVALRFGDGSEAVPPGKYPILYAIGGIPQTVADAFSLANPVAPGTTVSFEVVDSSILVLSVAVGAGEAQWASLQDGVWTGRAGDGRFSSSGNWLGDSIPVDGASLVVMATTDSTLVCDIPGFSPKSIAFPATSALVTINAFDGGSMTNIERIVNSAAGKHHVFNVPIQFKEGVEADITMDADRYMDFAGGMSAWTVKKTGGDVYYCGNVTLTKEDEDWCKKDYAYIVSGATLSLPSIINSGGRKFRIEGGGKVRIAGDYTLVCPVDEENGEEEQEVEHRFVTSYNAGTLEVAGRIIASGMCRLSASYWNANGVVIANGLVCSAEGDNFCLNGDVKEAVSAKWVIGEGGFTATAKGFWVLAKSGTTVELQPKADYAIDANMGVRMPLIIGTTDYFDATPRTVTVNGKLYKDGSVKVKGSGTVVFNSVSGFTGGLTVEDAATLRLAARCTPGGGAVTMASGTTLAVPGRETAIRPLLESLAVKGGGKVMVRVGNGVSMLDGNMPIARFSTVPDNATLAALSLENPAAVSPYFYMDGNILMVHCGDGAPLSATRVWTGAAGDGKMSNPENWQYCEVPPEGVDVVIGCGRATELDCDIDFKPKSITFPADSAPVTIGGGGTISGLCAITNNAQCHHIFKRPVACEDGVTVKITMASDKYMDFKGGITMTDLDRSENPKTYCGNFTITGAGDWNAGDGATLKTGSTLNLPNAAYYDHNARLTIESGATCKVKQTKTDGTGSKYLTKRNDGVFIAEVEMFSRSTKGGYVESSVGDGVFISKQLRAAQSGYMVPGRKHVLGPDGILRGSGYLRMANNGSHYFGSYDDWMMFRSGMEDSSDYILYKHNSTTACALAFDTADWYDRKTPHTIRCNAPICGENANTAASISMTVSGTGVFSFECSYDDASSWKWFSGGLTVKDTATVRIKSGCKPGNGALCMAGGSTLALPPPGSSPIALGGGFAVSGTGKVGIVIGETNDVLSVGSYTLLTASSIPDVSRLELVNRTAGSAEFTKSADGKALLLAVVALPDVAVDVGGGKIVAVPQAWLDRHPAIVAAAGGDKVSALHGTAANGRLSVVDCYVLGLDPEDESDDFRILSIPMKADGTPDLAAVAIYPPQSKWNMQGAAPVLKGTAALGPDADWQTVTDQNKTVFRFFKMEVLLP